MPRDSAYIQGVLTADELKDVVKSQRKYGDFFYRGENRTRLKKTRIASAVKRAKKGKLLSSKKLNREFLFGFRSEFKK